MCFKKSGPVFRPQYKVTDRILNNITRSTAAKELISQVHLPPDWIGNFKREAILKSAQASAALEGNPLGFAEVSRLVVDRQVPAQLRTKQEVLNYVHALETVDSILRERRITEERLLRVHYMLTESTLENPAESGVLRQTEVTAESVLPGEQVFPAPRAKEVPGLVKQLLTWLDSFEAEKLNALIQAGIVQYEIMRIHPFAAGNGLVARYLATVLLYIRNFDTKRLFSVDEYYSSNPSAYFAALNPSDAKNPDLTPWLEYFTDGVAQAVAAVKERVISLTSEHAPYGFAHIPSEPEPSIEPAPETRAPLT